MISVAGIGSGLDVNSIISQLIAVEGDAKTTILARKRASVQSEISAFGSLKGALSGFKSSVSTLKSVTTYQNRNAASGDEDVFTASASSNTVPGKFEIEVLEVATAHKLASQGYGNGSSIVGTGTLTIQVGDTPFDLIINENNQTLTSVRDAINDASNNTGVSATIINVDSGGGGTEAKLVLTSNNTGSDGALRVTVDDDDGNDIDASGLSALVYDPLPSGSGVENISEIVSAVDAQIEIDGQAVTNSSNTIIDAIQGVTINLKKKDVGNNINLEITADTEAIRNAVSKFVGGYNGFIGSVNDLASYDAEQQVAGVLFGNATLSSISGQIRREINTSINTPGLNSITNLVDIGITTGEDGKLILNETKLNEAISSDSDALENLFRSDGGVATKLDALLNEYVKNDGILDTKTTGLNKTLNNIDEDFELLDRRLQAMEERLLNEFSALDVLISQLQSTSSFLEQQLSAIATIGKKK